MTTRLAKGNCFPVAWRYVVDGEGLTLCHGLVTQPETGQRHCHAWAEAESGGFHWKMTVAIDKANGNDSELPTDVYYAFGEIDTDEVARYTTEEASILLCKHKNYGPWEERLLSP